MRDIHAFCNRQAILSSNKHNLLSMWRYTNVQNNKISTNLLKTTVRHKQNQKHLLVRNFDFARADSLNDSRGMFSIDGAADGLRGSQDFSDSTVEGTSHGSGSHDTSNLDDGVKGNVTIVLD